MTQATDKIPFGQIISYWCAPEGLWLMIALTTDVVAHQALRGSRMSCVIESTQLSHAGTGLRRWFRVIHYAAPQRPPQMEVFSLIASFLLYSLPVRPRICLQKPRSFSALDSSLPGARFYRGAHRAL